MSSRLERSQIVKLERNCGTQLGQSLECVVAQSRPECRFGEDELGITWVVIEAGLGVAQHSTSLEPSLSEASASFRPSAVWRVVGEQDE